MRDTLPLYPFSIESGIVNFNTSNQAGSHWICYYLNKNDRINFDSFGQITPVEIQRYLKQVEKSIAVGKLYRKISHERVSVWSSLLIRIEIIRER